MYLRRSFGPTGTAHARRAALPCGAPGAPSLSSAPHATSHERASSSLITSCGRGKRCARLMSSCMRSSWAKRRARGGARGRE
eukprot:7386059-Prymnesium_polylepis.1